MSSGSQLVDTGTAADPHAECPGAFIARSHDVGACIVVTLAGELDLATVPAAESELARTEKAL